MDKHVIEFIAAVLVSKEITIKQGISGYIICGKFTANDRDKFGYFNYFEPDWGGKNNRWRFSLAPGSLSKYEQFGYQWARVAGE